MKDFKEIQPNKITDLLDNIELYLDAMRESKDMKEIPDMLNNYTWGYFRNVNPDKDKLRILALFVIDNIYRYAARATRTDDYTTMYFASVVSNLMDTLQSRGIDMFYILDNEIREDRFMLTVQLLAMSGVAVVFPYMVKGNYHKYMTLEDQAKWALTFTPEDYDPNKITITMDSSEFLREAETLDLIKKYMKHTRNIAYIEKDSSVNYLDEVQKIAKDSDYICIFRNRAPDDPNVTLL